MAAEDNAGCTADPMEAEQFRIGQLLCKYFHWQCLTVSIKPFVSYGINHAYEH